MTFDWPLVLLALLAVPLLVTLYVLRERRRRTLPQASRTRRSCPT